MATAFVITTIATSALVGFGIFQATRSAVSNEIRERLVDFTALAALQLDVEAHSQIRTEADEKTDAYKKIHRYLMGLRKINTDFRYVYTYRIDENRRMTFVVDAEDKDSPGFSPVGEVFEKPSKELLANYRPGGKPTAENDFETDRWGVWLTSVAPVFNADGEVECGIGIDISAERVREQENLFAATIIGLSLGIGVLVALLSVVYSRRISRPLLELAGELGRVQRLDLGETIQIRSWVREVIVMQDAVQKLKNGLRSFRKYVPADLVADLMTLDQEARLSAEKREITVFFSDIADFTLISERTLPERLVENLAPYFEGMTRSIIEHGGTVDKYIGDCVMAFWGAPRPLQAHAVQACRSALRCRDHSNRVATEQQLAGELAMRTRIGLNTGSAIIGNIGFDDRLNYTAMGDTVNLASRLEGLNKVYRTQILISESTRNLAKDAVETRLIDIVAVKGKTVPVRIYELIAECGEITPDQMDLVAGYERAFDLYLERRFEEAIAGFEALSARYPDDHATSVLLGRARRMLLIPPSLDWQGEFVALKK